MTYKELQEKLARTLKDRMASSNSIEEIEIRNDYVIVKYEEKCPVTGGHTYDYLFIICDQEGNVVDPVAFGSLELAQMVVDQNAMNDPKKIQSVVDQYNEIQRYIRHAV